MAAILWEPSPERVEQSQLRRFQRWLGEQRGVACADTRAMHAWSTTNPGEFWAAVWDFAEVVGERGPALVSPGPAFHQWRFLPEATLNVAQTLLRDPSDEPAMLYRGEDGEAVDLSRAELHALVSRMQQMLRAADVEPGDRVAAMLPNRPEAYALAIAAASVGALFSSVSPDFGVDGALDRFGQIAPKVLVATPGYSYAGTRHDVTAKAEQIAAALPSLVATHLVTPGWLDAWQPAPVGFTPLPFDHPWLVLFSSGTTGKPKCIVHRAGGVLLKHLSEQLLHCDVQPRDRVFYFTTTGWMMFNWLGSALAARAALVLYDGSPVHPDNRVLFDLIDSAGITLFGTSAKFIDGCRKAELRPRDSHDLGTLRTITSTRT
jgi:acetoacetyl-CoA synthetase